MVMRWKILDMAQSAGSLDDILHEIEQSDHFDLDRDEALRLIMGYTELLPGNIRKELEAINES